MTSAVPQNPLDRLGRPLHDLRISVMDRCNFRCPYCMPKDKFHEHYRFLKSQERLSFEEIVRLARLFAARGQEAAPHRRRAAAARQPRGSDRRPDQHPGIEDIALTTNGVLLAQHAVDLHANGLKRVTVSLDTLDEDFQAA
jgi:GTP 3',8-cyclase